VYEASIEAAQQLFTVGPLFTMLVMLPISLLCGAMPGSSLPVAVAILSLAGHLGPWITVTAIVFFLAAHHITEPLSAILLGIPGHRAAQATVLDGYPMTQKGLAGVALGASYTCTLVGGIIGALFLLILLPVSRQLLTLFGSAEFFLLSLMGLIAVAVVSSGAFVKGMLTAAFGLAISMIGFAPIGGVVRATFGISYLWDGVPLAPIIVGLFAIPEAVNLVVSGRPISRERIDIVSHEAGRDVYRGMREALNHKWLLVRSALIGTFVGMMPGTGAATAHWIAYVQGRLTERGGRETFGKGDVRGLIAADSAMNSCEGGELIPTIVFGIPGTGSMAILLAVLVLSGMQPGPTMLTQHLALTLSLVYTIVIANLVVVPIMLVAAPFMIRLVTIAPDIIAPILIGIVTLVAYQTSNSMGDLLTVLIFGTLGIFMKHYGWPRPPILMALVLSKIVEKYLWLSINTYGYEMLFRPQFVAIIVFMLAITVTTLRLQSSVKKGLAVAEE
jgi:TctA family transporter